MGAKAINVKVDLGDSVLVPYISGETAEDRHMRRWNTAMQWEPELRQWCENNGIVMKVIDDHFQIYFKSDGWVVEWSVKHGRLCINQKNKHMVKAHDWFQVQYVLAAMKRGAID